VTSTTLSLPGKLKSRLTRKQLDYYLYPDLFSHIHLGRRLWQRQKDIANSVLKFPLNAVKGCHASGKTFVASGLPLYWLTRFKQGKCFITAPTLRQVKGFWGEISIAREKSMVKKLLPEPTTTRLEVNAERYAFGASSSKGVNIQGLHGHQVLIICDEAPGIETDIWDAIEGIRAGGTVRVLKLGNPVVPIGDFYDAFTRARGIHNCMSISAFDTPNLQNPLTGRPLTFDELLSMSDDELDWAPFPYLITRRWVKERYIVWGPNHPKFQSRVMAEFPKQSPYAVFELGWLERAKREPTEEELGLARRLRIQIGIDVAGPGDDETTLCARVGGIILEQHAWHSPDPMGEVVKIIQRLRAHPLYQLGEIVVDVTGIGYYFARGLAAQGIPNIYGFNASQRAVDNTQYADGKSEAYFTCREYFKAGVISGLNDEECDAQLSTMLYHENPRGLTEIRSKEYMRTEVKVPSPDRAEGLILAFMKVVPRVQGATFGGFGTYQISPV
jgi:hypothetical protein